MLSPEGFRVLLRQPRNDSEEKTGGSRMPSPEPRRRKLLTQHPLRKTYRNIQLVHQRGGLEGRLLGTPHFESPESIRGRVLTLQADIFSLGVLLYQALAGRRPFEDKEGVHVVIAQLTQPFPLLCGVDSLLQPFDRVISRACTKEPRERYAEYRSFANDLRELQSRFTPPTESLRVLLAPLFTIAEDESPGEDPYRDAAMMQRGSALLALPEETDDLDREWFFGSLSLAHSGVVRVMSAFEGPGGACALELDLDHEIYVSQLLRSLPNRRLHPSLAIDLFLQVIETLDAMQALPVQELGERDVVHGELDPSRLWIDREGIVKISDFGYTPNAAFHAPRIKVPEAAASAPGKSFWARLASFLWP
jgi:serine/threonine protein kinase